VRVNQRVLLSRQGREVYVTATPSPGAPAGEQAREAFAAIGGALREAGGFVFQERIFAAEDAFEAILRVRQRLWPDLDDGVGPVRLISPEGLHGPLAGVQVHAVCLPEPPKVLRSGPAGRGRLVSLNGRHHVALSGLSAPEAGDPESQALAVFEEADDLLRQAGGDLRCVARTWLWLKDILSWYDGFNRVRNAFFAERGLTDGAAGVVRMPASTGIGVGPAGGARCALDVLAVVGSDRPIRYLEASGKQNSPYRYGSAFSRAARSPTPAGETVYVSGTAAIDAEGGSQHLGDAARQIETTLANVRAVLAEQGCGDGDVVQAMAYCKNPEVEAVWRDGWGDLAWPCVTAVSDVCRDELLFEAEATACPGATEA